MKEEIQRINKLVAEGKLSPEDAAELIDAFYNASDYRSEHEEPQPAAAGSHSASGSSGSAEAPPPPPRESKPGDPFAGIIDTIERLGKDITQSVDWREVTDNARTSARKGIEALRAGLDELSKGKFQLGWLLSTATRDIQLPLEIKDGQSLQIENGCGNIKVIPSSVGSVVIARARFRGATNEDARRKADEYSLIVESSDLAVKIRQPHVSGQEVDLEIHLAATPATEITSEAGDVEVRDTKNSCRIQSISGDIVLSGLGAQVEVVADSGTVTLEHTVADTIRIENKAGDIRVRSCSATLNLRSANGDISVGDTSGRTVAVDTVSGSIDLSISEPVSGSVSARAVSGNANVQIARGSDARVAVSTIRGIAYCSVDLLDKAQNDQRITGHLGDGNGSIDISSVQGNVSLGYLP